MGLEPTTSWTTTRGYHQLSYGHHVRRRIQPVRAAGYTPPVLRGVAIVVCALALAFAAATVHAREGSAATSTTSSKPPTTALVDPADTPGPLDLRTVVPRGSARIALPQGLLQHVGRHLPLCCTRGVRVPQAMQPECRHRGQIPHSASEAPTDNIRVLRRAPGPAED